MAFVPDAAKRRRASSLVNPVAVLGATLFIGSCSEDRRIGKTEDSAEDLQAEGGGAEDREDREEGLRPWVRVSPLPTFGFYSPSWITQEASMEVQAHTTPESRQALRNYLRNRRLTTSIHQTITTQTLNDLEDALPLLQGTPHPSEAWTEEIENFLS